MTFFLRGRRGPAPVADAFVPVGADWSFDATVEQALDEVATELAGMLDVDALFAAARAPAP